MHPRHVYVHVPFCARRCSYCDFSIAVRREVPVHEYLKALGVELQRSVGKGGSGLFSGLRNERELQKRDHSLPGRGRWPVDTIYLGGGTPSRLGADGICQLIELLTSYLEPTENAEITMEANPDDITPESVRAWVSAGINRLSVGVQSFDNRVLEWMHRTHSSAQIKEAVGAAKGEGISNISVDLIFALPASLERDWSKDLHEAIELSPCHISLYGLTVEPKTPLARWEERGQIAQAPEENYEREYLTAHDVLEAAGFEHYEVSNFGKPGFHSRHNSAYWTGVPYLGLGPSAHSFDGVARYWNVAPYAEWVEKLNSGSGPGSGAETMNDESREIERVYLGLRTKRGAAMSPNQLVQAKALVAAGWGTLNDDWLTLSPLGWLRLDSIVQTL